MPSQQKIHAAHKVEQEWNLSVPPSHLRNSKMQLLTIGGISVTGNWYGSLGQCFVGWAPLLAVSKDMRERANEIIRTSRAAMQPHVEE